MATLCVLFREGVQKDYRVRDGWRVPPPRADRTLTFQDMEGRDFRLNWDNVLVAWTEG